MPREKMSDRRASWTQRVELEGQKFYATFGEYADGRLGEVFVVVGTGIEGTFARGVLDGLARMTSLAIQCGCPLADVVKALRGINFPPNGKVVGSGSLVKDCTSVVDWLAQEMEAAYLGSR